MSTVVPSREILSRERAVIVSTLESRGARDVRVFGSLARGDDDASSDIDLLVDLPADQPVGIELLTVLGLSEELSRALGTRVEVATPRTLRDEVRATALAEAIPL
jgi:predicted nucleotidyltransferase